MWLWNAGRCAVATLPPDRFEAENVEFHEKLREAFRALAADEPERCVIIDASVPRVQVAKDIWDTVQAKLDPATAPLALEEPAPESLVS